LELYLGEQADLQIALDRHHDATDPILTYGDIRGQLGLKILFKRSVAKDLKRIDTSKASEILDKIDTELSNTADTYPALKGKFAGLREFRMGEYRNIYAIVNNDTVLILRIAHRKELNRKK
jgi:mRNA interferase RelE/StbE